MRRDGLECGGWRQGQAGREDSMQREKRSERSYPVFSNEEGDFSIAAII